MEARISAIALVVKDKAKALEFYTEKLGFEKKTDYTAGDYRYLTDGPKGKDLVLALWQVGSPDPTGRSKNYEPGNAPHIVLRMDDCRRTFAELDSKGVEFRQELKEYPWRISTTFLDPDGNHCSINQLHRRGS